VYARGERSGEAVGEDLHVRSIRRRQYQRRPSPCLEFLFSDWRFEQIVGGAAVARRLKVELAGHGWLDTGGDRYSVRRTIGKGADGKGHREQVIAVRAAAFDYRP
jgi:hypothetical protein